MNAVAEIGGNTGAPDWVGDEGVADGIVDRGVSFSVGLSWVDTFFSEGKKVFMTGRDSRPTRPSCTALDVVLAVREWGRVCW